MSHFAAYSVEVPGGFGAGQMFERHPSIEHAIAENRVENPTPVSRKVV